MSMSIGLASASEHDSPDGVPHPCFSPLFAFSSPFPSNMLLFHLNLAFWVPSRSFLVSQLLAMFVDESVV